MIRKLDASFANELVPLLSDLGYPDQTNEKVSDRINVFLSNSNSWIFGVFADNQLAGFASLSLIPLIHEDGYLGRISALSIKKKFQGAGLGRKLITHLEDYAFSMNCSRIEITSSSKRTSDAHVFYERVGYRKYDGARFLKSNRK